MNMSLIRVVLFALISTFVLLGCGRSGLQTHTNASKYDGLTSEEQLRVRIQERWDALIAMDIATVYSYATPTYRATHDLRHLAGQYGGQIQRKRIDISSITLDEAGTTADVKVEVWASTSGFGSQMIDISTISKGTWLKRDGLWWFVEPR